MSLLQVDVPALHQEPFKHLPELLLELVGDAEDLRVGFGTSGRRRLDTVLDLLLKAEGGAGAGGAGGTGGAEGAGAGGAGVGGAGGAGPGGAFLHCGP